MRSDSEFRPSKWSVLYAVRDEEQNVACPVREWNAVKYNKNW